MTKILKHAGVEYSLDKLIKMKGQGININTNSQECVACTTTIVSSEIKNPFVIKQNKGFLILVDTTHSRGDKTFDVVLFSKHALKKAKVEIPVVNSPVRANIDQGSFKRSSPWVLASESARAHIRQ